MTEDEWKRNDDVWLNAAMAVAKKREGDAMNFGYLCTLLPEGVMWGDPITPEIIREIVNAVDRAAREECVLVCERIIGDMDRQNWTAHNCLEASEKLD
jgi:hypothetical protein